MVLRKMSEASGVRVTTPDAWLAGFPVSIVLKDATLEQGLRKLLGNLNYSLECRKKQGQVASVVIRARRPSLEPPASLPPIRPALPPVGVNDGAMKVLLGVTNTQEAVRSPEPDDGAAR